MDWSFGDVIWAMIVFFFWFMLIWLFITVVADIFRREDLSGWSKAIWLFVIFFFTLIGILIYMIARPKMTEQDKRELAAIQEQQRRLSGYSSADEIAKAAELHAQGKITDEEFTELKRRALA